MLTPAEIAAVAVRALEEKKAKDVKVLKTYLAGDEVYSAE